MVQNSGFPNEPFLACYFIDNQNGWVVGGRQLKSTNGGENWVDKSPIEYGVGWAYSVYFLDTLNGFIGGDHRLFKTTDGGNSWDTLYTLPIPGNWQINSIYFADYNRGWIAGGYSLEYGNFLSYTENGGLSWSEISVPTDNGLLSLAFSDSLHGFAIGNDGFMMKTTDGGISWFQSSLGSNILQSIHFVSELNGWITGYAGIYRTTNGGVNWTWHLVEPTGSVSYGPIFFVDSLHGYTSSYEDIFYSSNGGITWAKIDDRGVYSLFFISQLEGWGVGAGGLILHTVNGGATFLEDENNFAQPKNFELEQNYPNPFNPTTSIQYAVSSRELVTLKVYDVLGREAATLVNEEKQPGIYEVEFDAVQLSSGIYYYQLLTGTFSETKKMMVIK